MKGKLKTIARILSERTATALRLHLIEPVRINLLHSKDDAYTAGFCPQNQLVSCCNNPYLTSLHNNYTELNTRLEL